VNIAIRSCPFCGAGALPNPGCSSADFYADACVCCNNCGARVDARGFGEKPLREAVADWNRRTISSYFSACECLANNGQCKPCATLWALHTLCAHSPSCDCLLCRIGEGGAR
jgi:hypothetical protein